MTAPAARPDLPDARVNPQYGQRLVDTRNDLRDHDRQQVAALKESLERERPDLSDRERSMLVRARKKELEETMETRAQAIAHPRSNLETHRDENGNVTIRPKADQSPVSPVDDVLAKIFTTTSAPGSTTAPAEEAGNSESAPAEAAPAASGQRTGPQ